MPESRLRGLVAVAAGYEHSLGLKADGSIVAWGANDDGGCDVPAPNSGFVAITAGGGPEEPFGMGGHSLGLKADEAIVTWGWNASGHCDPPAPNRGFVAVSAGYGRCFGLTASYGDLNNSGVVDLDDVDPFVEALVSEALGWNLAHPGWHRLNADCNGDGTVDFNDVNRFVALLTGP